MLDPISVVIITLNEAEHIEQCIRSCQSVSKDIIVVDSGSTDDTIPIAKALGATVYNSSWMGYGSTKNFGATKASNNWILSIDADEVLDAQLIMSIKATTFDSCYIYAFNRKTKLGTQWVNHSGWHPQYLNRIYNKQHCQWNQDEVHEQLECHSKCKKVVLKGLLLHYSFKDKSDYETRQNQYAYLRAKYLEAQPQKPSVLRKKLGPIGRFLTIFFFKRGFMDGRLGWYIANHEAKMMAFAFKLMNEQQST